MESNVRTLASNLGRFFRPSEAYFVPMKHPRVALRAPLVRFMGTKNASSVRKNPLVYGLGTKLPILRPYLVEFFWGARGSTTPTDPCCTPQKNSTFSG